MDYKPKEKEKEKRKERVQLGCSNRQSRVNEEGDKIGRVRPLDSILSFEPTDLEPVVLISLQVCGP